MTSSTEHEFVILGANIGGIGAAHYILKHIIPAVQKLNPTTKYHVTVVSPSTHHFWKIGAPRTLASPDLIPFDKTFLPIADAFKQYSAERYTLELGTAVDLDPSSRTVTIEDASKSTKTIKYSTLVIATGTSSASALWTLNGSHENSKREMADLHALLPKAETILIAGGGPAGTETAGEIAALYPKAQTTILSGSTRLLSRLLPSTSKAAESRLQGMGVEVVNASLQVRSTSKTATGQTQLALSDGTSRTVDVYIDSTGGKPNTAFLPPHWLNPKGLVLTDGKTMRATFTPAEQAHGVYAIGDAASYSTGAFVEAYVAVAPLGSSIALDLGDKAAKQKTFKSWPNTQFVPTGPSGGVGQLLGYRVPSLMVWGMKSRNFMTWMAPKVVSGADL